MIVGYRALSSRVLVVAVCNPDIMDWAAYCDAVPGHNHDDEVDEVARVGNKIRQDIATLLFPDTAVMYKWRE